MPTRKSINFLQYQVGFLSSDKMSQKESNVQEIEGQIVQTTTKLQLQFLGNSVNSDMEFHRNEEAKQMFGLEEFITLHQQEISLLTNKIQFAFESLTNKKYSQSQKTEKAIKYLENNLDTSMLYPHIELVKSIRLQSPSVLQNQITTQFTIKMITQKEDIISQRQSEILHLKEAHQQLNQRFSAYSTQKEKRIKELEEINKIYSEKQVQYTVKINNQMEKVQTLGQKISDISKAQRQKNIQMRKRFQKVKSGKQKITIQKKQNQDDIIDINNDIINCCSQWKQKIDELNRQIYRLNETFQFKQTFLSQKVKGLQDKVLQYSKILVAMSFEPSNEQISTLSMQTDRLKQQVKDLDILSQHEKSEKQNLKAIADSHMKQVDDQITQLYKDLSEKEEFCNKLQENQMMFQYKMQAINKEKEKLMSKQASIAHLYKELQITHHNLNIENQETTNKLIQESQALQRQKQQNQYNSLELQLLKDKQSENEYQNKMQSLQNQNLKITLKNKDLTIDELDKKLKQSMKQMNLLMINYENTKIKLSELQKLLKEKSSEDKSKWIQVKQYENVCQKYKTLKETYTKDTSDNEQALFLHLKSLIANKTQRELSSFREALKITMISFTK